MANLTLDPVELVSTLRAVPANGAPSTDDFNEGQREVLLDLTSLAELLNESVLQILMALPDSAAAGLTGAALFGDPSDQTSLFTDSQTQAPLTVADVLRALDTRLSSASRSVSDVKVAIGQLQSKLSSSSQNDVAQALQNITNTLNAIQSQQKTMQTAITAAGQPDPSQEQRLRVPTGNIAGGSTEAVEVDWTLPISATGYAVNIAVEDDSGFLVIQNFTYKEDGSGILVRIKNNDISLHAGFVHVFVSKTTA